MSNLFINQSGCYDPTAGMALSKIQREQNAKDKALQREMLRARPLVYLCTDFLGNMVVSDWKSAKFCKYIVRKGKIPISRQLLYSQVFDTKVPSQREMEQQYALALLGLCSEVWVFRENTTLPAKVHAEIRYARKLGKPVKFFDSKELKLWL